MGAPAGGVPNDLIPEPERFDHHVPEMAEQTAKLRKYTTTALIGGLIALVLMAGFLLLKQDQRHERSVDKIDALLVQLEEHQDYAEAQSALEAERQITSRENLKKANIILAAVLRELKRLNPNDPALQDIEDLLLGEAGEGEGDGANPGSGSGDVPPSRNGDGEDSSGDVGDGGSKRRDQPRDPGETQPRPRPSPRPPSCTTDCDQEPTLGERVDRALECLQRIDCIVP